MLPAKSVISPVNQRFIWVLFPYAHIPNISGAQKRMPPDFFLAQCYHSVLQVPARVLRVICHFPTKHKLFALFFNYLGGARATVFRPLR